MERREIARVRPKRPQMSFEAWSLAASVGTLLVIAATAIAAMIQLRHMRSSNQITVFSKLEEMWNDPEFRTQRRRVTDELDARLRDPAFRAELERESTADEFALSVVEVANFFEGMAIYAKRGLADTDIVCDFWSAIIVMSWNRLAPAIAVMRRSSGPLLYENFQYLAIEAQRYIEAHPEGTVPLEGRSPIPDRWLNDDHSTREPQPNAHAAGRT